MNTHPAMLSWFLGWQSDRCADFRANRIKYCISVLFFIILPTHRAQNFLRIETKPLLAEMRPLLYKKVKFYTNPLKTNFKRYAFIFFSTDWPTGTHPNQKKYFIPWFFNLIFYFRQNDCIKMAREKPAIRQIKRAWPQNTCLSVPLSGKIKKRRNTIPQFCMSNLWALRFSADID